MEGAGGVTQPNPSQGLLTPEEIEDFKELRLLLRPTETLRVLDEFSKWLFASAAVVGALGAGLGVSGLNGLDGAGSYIFASAVLCLALSLTAAVFARMPQRRLVHRNDSASMSSAVDGIATRRYRLLIGAGLLFAAALVLAGIAPLA